MAWRLTSAISGHYFLVVDQTFVVMRLTLTEVGKWVAERFIVIPALRLVRCPVEVALKPSSVRVGPDANLGKGRAPRSDVSIPRLFANIQPDFRLVATGSATFVVTLISNPQGPQRGDGCLLALLEVGKLTELDFLSQIGRIGVDPAGPSTAAINPLPKEEGHNSHQE